MARKRRGRKQGMVKKILKGAMQLTSGFLIGSPVFVPAAMAAGGILQGASPASAGAGFLWELAGIDSSNKINTGKLTEVLGRDAALVAVGFGVRWLGKRV